VLIADEDNRENQTISVIDIATGRITRRYGHPGVPGSGPGYYYHPDDAMLLPGGQVLVADILNCRILLLSARRITRQLGSTEYGSVATGLVVVQVGMIVAGLGLAAAITRHGILESSVALGTRNAAENKSAEPRNFEEFIYKVWGAGIAKHFAVPYNRKLWAVPLTEMANGMGRLVQTQPFM